MSGTVFAEDGRLRFDGLETRLAGPLSETQQQAFFETPLLHSGGIEVQDVPGQPFPNAPASGNYIALAILDANNRLAEIVHLTNYTQGQLSGVLTRGEEGTTPRSHLQGAKVVHAATLQDYLNVQDHEFDPQAHAGIIKGIADGIMQGHLDAHENDPNADPHVIYVRKDNAVLETMVITDTLVIRPNAQLVVQGDLVIEGRLLINGYWLHIGPEPPSSQPDNLVWIKTVT